MILFLSFQAPVLSKPDLGNRREVFPKPVLGESDLGNRREAHPVEQVIYKFMSFLELCTDQLPSVHLKDGEGLHLAPFHFLQDFSKQVLAESTPNRDRDNLRSRMEVDTAELSPIAASSPVFKRRRRMEREESAASNESSSNAINIAVQMREVCC